MSEEPQPRDESIERGTILATIRADLHYRLPRSGKPLRYIVLTREEAEHLLEEMGGEEAEWSCGHVGGAVCAECYRILTRKAHELAEKLIEAKRENRLR